MSLKLKMVMVMAALFAVMIALFGGVTLRHLRENQEIMAAYQAPKVFVATEIASSIHHQEKNTYLFILAGAIAASLVTWLAMRHLIHPLDEFANQVSTLRNPNGDLKKIQIEGDREISRLATAFNALVDQLNTSLAERIAAEQDLVRLANFDPLTGLPNRNLLCDRLRLAIARTKRQEHLLAVCLIDLDDFKAINDQYGHGAGDLLIHDAAHRLQDAMRGGDTVGRIGGDEFVLLLADLQDGKEMEAAVQRIQREIGMPFELAGAHLTISASIGVTLFPLDDADPDILLRHADQAMYRAKLAGRNRVHLFDADHDQIVQSRLQEVERLRRALRDGELMLYYQPKVNMVDGAVIGAEALLRWNHPERGVLAPGAFIGLADEHNGLIFDIGEWAIGQALEQMESWWRHSGILIPVSVNISANHLVQDGFIERLEAALSKHPGIPPECLELEILETDALEDTGHVSAIMGACRDLGVKFAIDDFGTGYSSLRYLKDLPANTLKIDQSFVKNMLTDEGDLLIVQGVISMAEVFKRGLIAEGVETVEHGRMLIGLGCRKAQGYGIAKPMPADSIPEWRLHYRPDSAWAEADMATVHFIGGVVG